MGRGLVAVGYAVGAALVVAHRRGRIPRPRIWAYKDAYARGCGATWFGIDAQVWVPVRAKTEGM